MFKFRCQTNLCLTRLFCPSSSHLPLVNFSTVLSQTRSHTLCCSPRYAIFSHSIPSLSFIVFSFPHRVNLLTLELSLSLALHLCHLSISLLVGPCEVFLHQNHFTSLSSICRPLLFFFFFHASCSHLARSLSCFSSFGPLALLGMH